MAVLSWSALLAAVVACCVSWLRSSTDTRAAPWITATLLALLAAMVTQVQPVVNALDSATRLGLTATLSNCCVLVTIIGAHRSLVRMVAPDTSDGRAATGTAWLCVALLGAFLVDGSNYRDVLDARLTEEQVPILGAASYLYVLALLPLSYALAKVYARWGGRVGRVSLRIAMYLFVACAVGTGVYALARLAAMITYQAGVPLPVLRGDLIGYLMRIAIALLLLGLAVPVLGSRMGWDRRHDRYRTNRRAAALLPLWAALREEFPEIVLTPRPTSPEHVAYRRTIEIWDGLLRLRPYRATPHSADPAEEARAIASALTALRRGDEPGDPPAPVPPPADDVVWLTEVSRHFAALAR